MRLIEPSLIFALGIFGTFFPVKQADAACNDVLNWLHPPSNEIKIFFNYRQDDYHDLKSNASGQNAHVFPPPLPTTLLRKPPIIKLNDDEYTPVSYYEPDKRGGYRLCRYEIWWPYAPGNDVLQSTLHNSTVAFAGSNIVLQPAATNGRALHATMYFYDSKGRLERISQGDYSKPSTPIDLLCRRYDVVDRVVFAISPTSSKVCPTGAPDQRDTWRRFEYAKPTDKVFSEITQQHHVGHEKGDWDEVWSPFQIGTAPDAPAGHAKVDSRKGVYEIYGSSMGKRDDNVANTVEDSFGYWNGSTYTFPVPPVSISVVTDIEALYKQLRRRQTYIEGSVTRLYELFKPNEHLSKHRYYMIGGYVARHEQ